MRYLHPFMQHLIDSCPTSPPHQNHLLYGIYSQCFLSQLNDIQWKSILNDVQWSLSPGWENCISETIYLSCSWGGTFRTCQATVSTCGVHASVLFCWGSLVAVWSLACSPCHGPSEYASKVPVVGGHTPSCLRSSRPSSSSPYSLPFTFSSQTLTHSLSPSATVSAPRPRWFCFVHGCNLWHVVGAQYIFAEWMNKWMKQYTDYLSLIIFVIFDTIFYPSQFIQSLFVFPSEGQE